MACGMGDVCMHACTCMCACTYMCTCVCACVCIHVCVCVCACMCVHVCVCVCTECACVRVTCVYYMVFMRFQSVFNGSLRLFLVLGVVWIAIFTVTNIGRMYSLQLLNSNATIVWYHGKYFG